MSKSSFELKEQIRDAIDIVDLVSRYIPSLRRQGRNYVGRCPWHDDSRPSLQVNPERQTFKCWVCDIGGDIFSFVMRMEGVDFKEALEILADMAGISLPEKKYFEKSKKTPSSSANKGSNDSRTPDPSVSSPDSSSQYVPAEITKPVLYRALDWLSEKYHQLFLTSPEAEGARNYIKDRGISDEMVRRFKIGYSPLHSETLLGILGADRNRVRILEAAGVFVCRQSSLLDAPGSGKKLSAYEMESIFDRFHGRVIFPIRDTQERTVAFGGRLLPNSTLSSPAKYLNSPETTVFTKSKMLYGLDLARNNIRKKKRVIITEGYTDCVMAHQFGFDETVAVLGTALGEEHVKILNRFADKIILVLDGDAAGRRRADEVLGLFVAQGADMSILTLPDDKDPCEFLLSDGAEGFTDQLDHHLVDALDHAFLSATEGVDLTHDIVGASRALDKLLSIIALYPTKSRRPGDPVQIRMAKTIQRLSEQFRIAEPELRKRLRAHRERLSRTSPFVRQEEGTDPEIPPFPSDERMNGEGDQGVRSRFILPNAEFPDETEEALAERFEGIPVDIWGNDSLLPNQTERGFFEFFFAFPETFSELMSEIGLEDFHSPISRQILLLASDLSRRGVEPEFQRILLRYDEPVMKNFLVGLDDAAAEKELVTRLALEANRQIYFDGIVDAFRRQRLTALKPGEISDLRNDSLSDDEQLQKLLKLQKILKKNQEDRGNQGGGLLDESPDSP